MVPPPPPRGIIYEADDMHVEVVLNQLQLVDAKFVSTLGTRGEQTRRYEIESE